jgi:predicted metalloprotease
VKENPGASHAAGPKPGNGKPGIVGAEVGPTSTTAAPTTTQPPPPDIEVTGDDGAPTNEIVVNAIADLSAWWAKEFPKVFDGKPFKPIKGGYFAIDKSTSTVGLPCAPDNIDDVLDNAYYCPEGDAIVWDQVGLIPDLAKTYGPFTPAVVLAHEWGHAVQDRAGFDAPTVIAEQQADCYAGAWTEHVKTDKGSRFRITTDDLDQALAGFLSLRDAPGSPADDPNAHGSGFDRVRAFQEGFEQGASRCAEYRVGDPKPFQFEFSSQSEFDTGGDLPLERTGTCTLGDDESGCSLIDLIFPSLDNYWKTEFPKISGGEQWKPMGPPKIFSGDAAPGCDGESAKGFRLFVCIPGRFVAFDGTDTIPAIYDKGGDFSVGTLFATQYGLDIEAQLGDTPKSEVTATLRGDCYAGAYSASILPGANDDPAAKITLSPGDLDEGVGVLLSSRSDEDRSRQGPGFDRVRAYGIGVTKGAAACSDVEPG